MKRLDIKLVDGEHANPLKRPLAGPSDVFAIFRSIKDHASETLLVVYLQDDLTGQYDVHSTGTASMTAFSTRDLFGRAYVLRARYLILIHNHPKGDPTPSPDDRQVLLKIEDLTRPIDGLDILDFIVVGDDRYWSAFAEADGGSYEAGALGDLTFGFADELAGDGQDEPERPMG